MITPPFSASVRPTVGLIDDRPDASSVVDGSEFFASDYGPGVLYKKVNGAWLRMGGRTELASTQVTHNGAGANVFTSSTIAGVDVPGATIAFDVVDDPVHVFFGGADMWHSVANSLMLLNIMEGATVLETIRGSHATASGRIPLGMSHARVDTPGSHSLKLQLLAGTAGNMNLATTVNQPVFLRAVLA
jgi:hypothetical protein